MTSVYDVGDPRRFDLGTPAEVLRSIQRAFTVAPSSKRIVEDILALPFVLDKIIGNSGTVVPDEALRHGRCLSLQWEPIQANRSELRNKARSFQRIDTLATQVTLHPDVVAARDIIKAKATR